ncbi:unnamed protein product [Lampetra planeri]
MTPAVEQHGTVRPADPSLADDRQTMSTHIGELLCAVAELVAKLDIGQPPMADLGPRDDAAAAAAELNVALLVSEDVIARCIQTHLGLRKCSALVASVTPAGETSEEDEPAPACATVAGTGGQRRVAERRGWRDRPPRVPPRPGFTRGVCFNCGRPGHAAVECRAPRQGRPRLPSSSIRPPSTSRGLQASRGAPHMRPSFPPHPSYDRADPPSMSSPETPVPCDAVLQLSHSEWRRLQGPEPVIPSTLSGAARPDVPLKVVRGSSHGPPPAPPSPPEGCGHLPLLTGPHRPPACFSWPRLGLGHERCRCVELNPRTPRVSPCPRVNTLSRELRVPEPRVSMPTLSSSAPPSRASVPLSYITAWSDGGGGPEEPPERLAWRQQMERRLRVLEELLETERDFLCDLRVFRKRVFMPLQQLGCASALNGDLDSVIALSSRLFSELRHLVITNDTPSQIVGSVFLGVRDEVEGVYKSYCAHHEQGLAEMEMWSHDPHSCDCLQASITALRGKRRLVDVPSFLILPVQRVTRYPLLLTELARHTPLSHPDCEPLARAVASLREANMAINNAQRLVVRRVPPPPAPLSVLAERLFRRGVSSLAKTTAQIRQLAGLTSRDDDGGEDLAKRFRVLHIDVKTSAATAATSPAAITATTSTVIDNENSNNNNNNNHTRQEKAEVAVAAVGVSGERLVASQPEGEAVGRHGNRAMCRVPPRRHSDAEGEAAPRSPWRRHEERSHTDGEMDDDDDGGGGSTRRTRAGLGLAKCAGDAKRRARSRPPGPKQESKSKQEEEVNPKQEQEPKQELKLKPKQEGKPTTERRLKPQKNRAENPGAEVEERVARWHLAGSEEATDSDRTDSVRTGSDSGFDSLSRSRNLPRPPARGLHPLHPPLPLPPPASPEAPEASSGRAPRRARTDGDHRGSPPRGPPRFSDERRDAPPPLRRPKSSHDLLGSGYDYNDDYGRPRSDCPALRRDRRPRCPPLHGDPAGPPPRAPDYGTLRPLHHAAPAPVFVHHTTDRVLGRQHRHRSPRGLDVVDCGIRLPPPPAVHRPPPAVHHRSPPAVHHRPPPGAHHRSPPIVHHRSPPPTAVHPDRGRQPPYRDSTVERGCQLMQTVTVELVTMVIAEMGAAEMGAAETDAGETVTMETDAVETVTLETDAAPLPVQTGPPIPGGAFYQAVFSFSALLPNQLSVRARERVRVLSFHDEAGNSAWWLAEGPAGQGYLPAAYLRASHYT